MKLGRKAEAKVPDLMKKHGLPGDKQRLEILADRLELLKLLAEENHTT
jgi:hypothetical protein